MFRALTTITTVIIFFTNATGQHNFERQPAVGIGVSFHDFRGADTFQNFGKHMKAGLVLHYQNSLSARFDYQINFGGAYLDLPDKHGASLGNGENQLLTEADFLLRGKLLKGKHLFSPYLQAGTGISQFNGFFGAYVPTGVGLQVNVWGDILLLFNSQYRLPLTNTQHDHFFHSISIAGILGRKKIIREKPLPPPPPPPVNPKAKDSDGDGIVDSLDACPLVPGLARYQGCPIPDRDHDGIPDDQDSCVDIPGEARYHGCPPPDRDHDGVPDYDDKCPDVAGLATNHGCPEIKETVKATIDSVAKKIFFETGKYILLPASYGPLNEVVKILHDNPNLHLSIEGHTDNVGTKPSNQILSENRAHAVLNYLESKGIATSRLQSAGYGQERPIANNASSTGRAMNRRVELKLHF